MKKIIAITVDVVENTVSVRNTVIFELEDMLVRKNNFRIELLAVYFVDAIRVRIKIDGRKEGAAN